MKIGDTVYWLESGDSAICSGQVVAVGDPDWKDNLPRQIVVSFNGVLVLKDQSNSWDQIFTSSIDAYRVGCSRLAKAVTQANQAMISLVDSVNSVRPSRAGERTEGRG